MKRHDFVQWTLNQIGCPYIWGAKGHLVKLANGKLQRVFDCSGLVTWAIWQLTDKSVDMRQTHNTDRLWEDFAPTDAPRPGDLALYGVGGKTPNPNHVMLVLGVGEMVYGATGGGRDTKTITEGKQVMVKKSYNYRPDFIGFRSLARLMEGESEGAKQHV